MVEIMVCSLWSNQGTLIRNKVVVAINIIKHWSLFFKEHDKYLCDEYKKSEHTSSLIGTKVDVNNETTWPEKLLA